MILNIEVSVILLGFWFYGCACGNGCQPVAAAVMILNDHGRGHADRWGCLSTLCFWFNLALFLSHMGLNMVFSYF